MNFATRSGGLNDFRVVWANGEPAQVMQANICVTSQIVATPRGIEARWPGQERCRLATVEEGCATVRPEEGPRAVRAP